MKNAHLYVIGAVVVGFFAWFIYTTSGARSGCSFLDTVLGKC